MILSALKGLLCSHKPCHQDTANYKYTCEPGKRKWTPLNSNLQMQGIQVKEYNPVPEKVKENPGNSFEDTMLLLDMVREKKKKENKQKKVGS